MSFAQVVLAGVMINAMAQLFNRNRPVTVTTRTENGVIITEVSK